MNVPNVDIPSSISELKDKVDLAKKDLPEDAEEPVVKEFSFDDTPVWIFSISWEYNWFEIWLCS